MLRLLQHGGAHTCSSRQALLGQQLRHGAQTKLDTVVSDVQHFSQPMWRSANHCFGTKQAPHFPPHVARSLSCAQTCCAGPTSRASRWEAGAPASGLVAQVPSSTALAGHYMIGAGGHLTLVIISDPHFSFSQVLSGFPVVAALMCVEHHDQLVQSIDGFIDQVCVLETLHDYTSSCHGVERHDQLVQSIHGFIDQVCVSETLLDHTSSCHGVEHHDRLVQSIHGFIDQVRAV